MIGKHCGRTALCTTTSVAALLIAATPAMASGDSCFEGIRVNQDVTCTVSDPSVTYIDIDAQKSSPNSPGDYTLNVDTAIHADENHDSVREAVQVQQFGGNGISNGDSGASADSVTVNLRDAVSLTALPGGIYDSTEVVRVFTEGGTGVHANSDGGDGGYGGDITVTGTANAPINGVESLTGVNAISLGGGVGSTRSNNGGTGGDGGAVTVDLNAAVTVSNSAWSFSSEGIAASSVGSDGGLSEGAGGDGGAVTITTDAVTNTVTAGGVFDSVDLGGIYGGSFGGDGIRTDDKDTGGRGGDGGSVTATTNGAITLTSALPSTGAGIELASKGGKGGDSAGEAFDKKSDGGHGGHGGAVTVNVHDAITTGGPDPAAARMMGVSASSRGSFGGIGNDKGLGGNGGHGGSVSVTTHDGAAISTMGDNATGLYAESIGGNGGDQNPGFTVIGVNHEAGHGGLGGSVGFDLGGQVQTQGVDAHAAHAYSAGGAGGDASGAFTLAGSSSGTGGNGGAGGAVTVDSDAALSTAGDGSVGILAQSLGSGGGMTESGSGLIALSGSGGAGATGGAVSVTQGSALTTVGDSAAGIMALSVGGGGGRVADTTQGVIAIGGQGGAGANAGAVDVTLAGAGAPSLTTQGDYAYGINAQSIGGGGGDGGSAFAFPSGAGVVPAVAVGGAGGASGNGQSVTLAVGDSNHAAAITTHGENAHGVVGHSIGGGGGSGGDAFSTNLGLASFAIAGGAQSGGDGGAVHFTTENGSLTTTGGHANAVALRSVGGGGGSGGSATSQDVGVFFGASVAVGGQGGAGGDGGTVSATVENSAITTGDAQYADVTDAHGVLAQSIGGGGGAGGSAMSRALVVQVPTDPPLPAANFAFAAGGSGGDGGDGGLVTMHGLSGSVTTLSDTSHGLMAQSIGGGGGLAGSGTAAGSLLQIPGTEAPSFEVNVGIGGNGGSGGHGGQINGRLGADILTQGHFSNAFYLQSIGGGGGDAGTGTARSLRNKERNFDFVTGGDAFEEADGLLSFPDQLTFEAGIGGTGGSGGAGGALNFVLESGGSIVTTGEGAKGVLAQSIGGGGGASQGATIGLGIGGLSDDDTVNNILSQSINLEVGRHGAHGGNGGSVIQADLSAPITTYGADADAVLIQSIGGGGGLGGSVGGRSADDTGRLNPMEDSVNSVDSLITASLALGGRGGAAGHGGNFTGASGNGIQLAGAIATHGDHAEGVVMQSIGGGGGAGGTGSPEDTNLLVRHFVNVGGSGGAGGDGGSIAMTLAEGSVSTAGFGSNGIVLQSIGGGGGIGASGSRQACEQVSLGGGPGSTLAGAGLPTSGDQDAACAALAASTARDDSQSGNQGASGDGGAITQHAGNGTFTVVTTGNHAHGLIAQSLGGGGGIGASGATELAGDGTGTATLRSSFVNVGGNGAQSSDTVSGAGGALRMGGYYGLSTGGDGSTALIAQSIGGGGGIYNVDGVSRLHLGGQGSSGSGTSVEVTAKGGSAIATSGEGGHGVLAQSIGSGGGLVAGELAADALTSSGTINLLVGGRSNSTSNAGAVIVSLGEASAADASIVTTGDTARGIIAQSVAGGGGVYTGLARDDAGPSVNTHLRVGGNSSGGDAGGVTVTLRETITTRGRNADGVVAQSIGRGGGIADIFANAGKSGTEVKVGGINGSASGDGGDVFVNPLGDNGGTTITTAGQAAYGILAQSIGGGGGLATNGASGMSGTLLVGSSSGGGGSGGAVSVSDYFQHLQTRGDDAHAIVAQSIGGGGGVARATANTSGDDLTTILGSAGSVPTGDAGAVTIDVSAVQGIRTTGDRAIGIVAQSISGGGGIATTGAANANTDLTLRGSTHANSAGAVSVTFSDRAANDLTTSGAGAHGIVAQSIGGGGGIAGDTTLDVTRMAANTIDMSGVTTSSTHGNGGTVAVDAQRHVRTTGANAYGIIAQSIGGGGGLFGVNGGGVAGRNRSGSGSGGDVSVRVHGFTVSATGAGSVGILAQSLGSSGANQGTVDVLIQGALTAHDYAVLINGGDDNNSVTVDPGASITSTTGKAIGAFDEFGGGVVTVNNSGTINGSILADTPLGNAFAAPSAEFRVTPQARAAAFVGGNGVQIVNQAGGVLTGATRYDGDVTNSGRIEANAQGNPLTIKGNFTQTDSGETVLGRVASATVPRIQVGGNAALGGTLTLEEDAPALGRTIQAFSVAGTQTGRFDAVRFGLVEYEQSLANGVLSLTSARTRFGDPGVALTEQQARIGRHLDAAFATGDGVAALIGQAAQVSTQTAGLQTRLGAFLDELAPDAIVAPAASAVTRADDRFAALIGCDGAAATSASGDACTKLDVSGSTYDQDADGDTAGYDETVFAITAGAEAALGAGLSAGFTLAYEKSDADGASGRSSVEGDTGIIGLSATQHLGDLSLSLGGAGTYGRYDTERRITLPNGTHTAAGDFSAWSLAARGRAAYDLSLGALRLTPALDVDVIHSSHEGFTESGGGGAGLTVDSGAETVLRATPSLEVSRDFDIGNGMTLGAYAGAGVSISSSDAYTVDARLSGAAPAAGTFESAIAMSDLVGQARIGAALSINERVSVGLDYGGTFSDDASGHTAAAWLNWRF